MGRLSKNRRLLFALVAAVLFAISVSVAPAGRKDNPSCQKQCNNEYSFCNDECNADLDSCLADCEELANRSECRSACRAVGKACSSACGELKSECKNSCPKKKESPTEPT